MTPAPDARQISERSLFKNRLASAFLLSLGALACLLVGSRTDDVRVLGPGILLAIASAIVLLAAIETAAYAPDGELRALAQHLRRLDPVESVRARHRDDAGRTRAVPHGGLSFAFGIVVIALLASCLTGGIATAHAFAEILQGRLTPPHPPPNALPPTVPPEPSPFSCRADPAVEIARGVNVDVGLTGSPYTFGTNMAGFGMGNAPQGIMFDEDGRSRSRAPFDFEPGTSGKLSRVSMLGDDPPMLDWNDGDGRVVGSRFRCGAVASSTRGDDIVSECRSFVSDGNVGWIIATHIRTGGARAGSVEQTLHRKGQEDVVLVAARLSGGPGPVLDASPRDDVDTDRSAPLSSNAHLVPKDFLHFAMPESARIGAWYVTTSFDGPTDVTLTQAIGDHALPSTRWPIGAERILPTIAASGGRVLVVLSVGGRAMSTIFAPGAPPSKPTPLDVGDGTAANVGRWVNVTADNETVFLAYVGAEDHRGHLAVLAPDLRPLLSPPIDFDSVADAGDDFVRYVRVLPLPGRSLLVLFMTRGARLKSAVVHCSGN
jgi:hypothetical protein